MKKGLGELTPEINAQRRAFYKECIEYTPEKAGWTLDEYARHFYAIEKGAVQRSVRRFPDTPEIAPNSPLDKIARTRAKKALEAFISKKGELSPEINAEREKKIENIQFDFDSVFILSQIFAIEFWALKKQNPTESHIENGVFWHAAKKKSEESARAYLKKRGYYSSYLEPDIAYTWNHDRWAVYKGKKHDIWEDVFGYTPAAPATPTSGVENQPTQIEKPPFTPCAVDNQPAEPYDFPADLNDLPCQLSYEVLKWRSTQYARYTNPKNKPNGIEAIFVSIEFEALKHCHGANPDFEKRRADYLRMAQWRARETYCTWFAKYGDKKNEKSA